MPKDHEENQKIQFNLKGLSCASCVGRAEAALKAVAGVEAAEVNLATHRAQVSFHEPATPNALFKAVEAAGYPAEVTEHSFEVEGATCASCVRRIETALREVPGVADASMNLANGKARVSASAGTDASALHAAIRKAGYDVHVEAPAEGGHDPAHAHAHDHGGADLRRNFWLALVLTLPIFIVEMGGHLVPAIHHWVNATIGAEASRTIQFLLTTIILVWPGRVFFDKGFPALMRGAPEMNSLVALGAGAAYLYSTVSTFAPGLMPPGTAHVYFESAAVIVTLILLGRVLEARAKGRAGEAIRKLLDLTPDEAEVKRDGDWVTLPASEVVPGDEIRLKPGERIAVDGVVLTGRSHVDEAMLTGEPVPAAKEEGDSLTGGTVNGAGTLTYRAVAVGRDTMLARIVAMVEEAQGSKLPVQALVDRITMWFVPAVMLVAALTLAAWLFLGPEPALGNALVAAVAVLIIACPCAMGLATPTSIMVGTGRAAELGVLFRKGDALQALQGAQVVAVDKTGTLTAGRPELTDVVLLDEGADRAEILRLLAALEAESEHPVAEAIVRGADAGPDLPPVEAFRSLTGRGVAGTVGGRAVLIGNRRLMDEEGVGFDRDDRIEGLADDGKTVFLAAIDGRAVAVLAVADPIKETTRPAIDALHKLGLKVAMLTGDGERTATAIAGRLGIDHVEAGLMPADKVEAITRLRARYGHVAFVGDGINDAPALAAADVGIAVGTGTDIAIETADVALMSGDLDGLLRGFRISRATLANIRQNLFWAFGYNVLLIPVAAGLIYPWTGTLLSPALAAGAMALSSVIVVTNALRLKRVS